MTYINRAILVFTVAVLNPVGAYADSWSCKHDKHVREVHIDRPVESATPCEVVYKKLTEGAGDQVLWNAQNDGSYCDSKAKDFVEKLEGWGWDCSAMANDDS